MCNTYDLPIKKLKMTIFQQLAIAHETHQYEAAQLAQAKARVEAAAKNAFDDKFMHLMTRVIKPYFDECLIDMVKTGYIGDEEAGNDGSHDFAGLLFLPGKEIHASLHSDQSCSFRLTAYQETNDVEWTSTFDKRAPDSAGVERGRIDVYEVDRGRLDTLVSEFFKKSFGARQARP